MKITNYNEFLLEKEFQRILEAIRLINEADTYNVGDTIEWDLAKDKGTPDEPSPEMEWTFDPKSKLQKAKDRISDFTSWLKKDDADIDLKFEHPIVNLLKNFVEKVKNEIKDPEKFRAKVKDYFLRMLDEIKSLPEKIKRDLLSKAFIVLAAYIPLSNIVTPDVIEKEPITAEIKADIDSRQQQKPVKTVVAEPKKETGKGKASFEKAHNMVMAVEGGYSADRADNGNYTNCKGERIFIGTNHGIATPTLITADVLPRGNTNTQSNEKYERKTSPEKIKELFRTSYGKNYEKLCGTDEKTFAEQWELDQKHIVDHDDIEYKWNQIMRHLSDETALDIYQKYYWTPQSFDNFKSQSIANVLYDACVNQGSGAALSVLRNSMESLGYNVEGIGSWDEFHEKLTPTVNKMNDAETENLFELIKKERIERYEGSDTFDDHGTGWTDRVKELSFVDGQTDSDLA